MEMERDASPRNVRFCTDTQWALSVGCVLDDSPQSSPEIAVSSADRSPVSRGLRCAQPALPECPSETRAEFARTEPRNSWSGTAGPTAYRQWQPLLFEFDHSVERRGIAHHRHEYHPVASHNYHNPDLNSRDRPDCGAHACQPLRRPRVRQRRQQQSIDLHGHLAVRDSKIAALPLYDLRRTWATRGLYPALIW